MIENAGSERLAALLEAPVTKDQLTRRWLSSAAVREFELGRITPEAFAERFIAEWHPACDAATFLDGFATWPKDFHPGALETLAALRATHRIGCLSNSNALHWTRFDQFAGLFDVTLSSHLIGLIKPDARCFEHAVAACGVPAAQIVFFDDALPNVLAARAAGMTAWQVAGWPETRAILESMGAVRVG